MISAIVPTYGGAARLARNLPTVAASLRAAGEEWEIVVVSDGGGDLGAPPEGARLIRLADNRGYGPAVNVGVEQAKGQRLLILNDDVRLARDTVTSLARQLVAGVFAVVPTIRSPLAACGDEGGKTGLFRAGLIDLAEVPSAALHPTLYPVGCCFLCERDHFRALGGYDEVFAPFFWEDVDLGYRAWRKGLHVLHVPEAACEHEGSATLLERFDLAARQHAEFRGRALFHLRNLQGRTRRAQTLGALTAHALFDLRARRDGLREALARFEAAGVRPAAGLSDEEILSRVGRP